MPSPDDPSRPSFEVAVGALADLARAFLQGAHAQTSPDARGPADTNSHPAGIVVLDEAQRIQALDAEAERLFGLAAADLFQAPVDALLPRGLPLTAGPERQNARGQDRRSIPVLVW